jgi:RNA-splicing ligase RtcB
MIEIKGKYNTASIYTDSIEDEAYKQVLNLMNQKFAEGSTFAIMPDCHAGAGCVIGLTMKIVDKVFPNLVGVDKATIDESPMAYKPMDEIIRNIDATAEIVKTIKPIYNFKAAE